MIYLACDHAGFNLKENIKTYFEKSGIAYTDISPILIDGDDYPDVAIKLAHSLGRPNSLGLALCGTGQGICIALNRFKNIRAVSTTDSQILKLTRQHNHANVLCLPARFLTLEQSKVLIKLFFDTKGDNDPRHIRRIQKLGTLDNT